MSSFKTWLEFTGGVQQAPSASRPGYNSNKEDKIQQLWDRIFADLGFKGEAPSKTAAKTLEELTETEPNQPAGKTIAGRLANVMRELGEVDPELKIDDAMRWLESGNEDQTDSAVAPKKQFSDFLKILFGEDRFHELLNRDPHSSDSQPTPSPQQPGTYTPDGGPAGPTAPPVPDMEPPAGPENMPPQQPQAPVDQQMAPPVQNPVPPGMPQMPKAMSYW